MSDSSAQSSQRMVSSFVGNPNSAVGSLLKRSLSGGSSNQPASPIKNDDSLSDNPVVNSIDPVVTPVSTSPLSIDPVNDSPDTDRVLDELEKLSKTNISVSEDKKDELADLKNLVDKNIPEVGSKDSSLVEKENLEKIPDSNNDLDLLEKAIAEAEASDTKSKVAAQEALSTQVNKLVQPVEKTLPEDKVAETQPVVTQQTETIPEPNNQQPSLPVQPLENSVDQTGLISQVIPQVIQKSTDTLNPQNPVSSAGSKEAADSASLDQIAIDAARGAQQVEVEPTPEISPEVESYLQKVEQHADTAPQEIVIADGSMTQPNNHPYPSQPVVVLPITPELEKKSAHKSPKLSVRWLVEWSKKIMKVFSGKVIYRLPEEDKS
ncbi:MAG: hypothetical protein HOE40_01475 [Candidatus Pacebacteria bacterium]|nr:hypothetical protein [Candidatus Paceibacterota bacterium]